MNGNRLGQKAQQRHAAQIALGITTRNGTSGGQNRRATFIENTGQLVDLIGTYLSGTYNNAAVRAPDGVHLLVVAGNHTKLPKLARSRVPTKPVPPVMRMRWFMGRRIVRAVAACNPSQPNRAGC